MSFQLTMPRDSWPWWLGVAAGSMACALVLTHAFWSILQQTPFLLGFGAAIVSSRVGGRKAGFLAVILGGLGYAWFPPPLPADGFGRLLFGFVIVSSAFSWLVARRYEIEADLHASQDRLRAVVSSLPIVLWVMNRDGYVTLAEGSGLEVLEFKPHELVGRSVFDLYRDVPEIITNTRRVLAGDTFTAIVTLGDIVVETWYSPMRDSQGSVTGAMGVSLDVTERTAAEEVVRQSERRLQTIINAEPACVKLVSADGILLDMNRAGLEMIGAEDVSQVLGRPVIDLVHPKDRHQFLEMHDAASSGTPGRCEFRVTGLKGHERWVDSHAVPFDTAVKGSETQRAVLSVTSDITEQKQLAEQLRQAQKMEAIGQLAGGVAHDFNNMLAIIMGYSDLLIEQIGPDKPIGRDLREIKAAAERAGTLTKQLLAFGRKQVLSLMPVDLTRIVHAVEPMLQRLLGERITITTALADDLVSVMADTAQLEHLLINLSVNARDAMPDGGVLTFTTSNVTLDAMFTRDHPGAKSGQYAMVSVADTGTGMSADVQARIFEPFFSTKEHGRGTGLGLAAAYGTAKQLGGYIKVESHVGRGTTFSVYLPKTTRTAEPVGPAESVSTDVGHETILLVEDESGVRAFLRNALQRFGYRVIEADTAEAALMLMKGHHAMPVDLLLTDLVLPGMDGTQLASHVTRERPQARVLFISGYARGLESIAGGLDPSLHLLEKPFTSHALLTKTRQLLGIRPEPGIS
jgi:PAS domain S-box-containing protein